MDSGKKVNEDPQTLCGELGHQFQLQPRGRTTTSAAEDSYAPTLATQ